ncbi:hypothetical protein TWF506_005048 [Arthrobotrys conoides]|uniref:Uncharacterized protein n=1 Tax=Arthrobotrys conoides TaxID=74498 RepID=A0AAN8RVS0_9PEZI
MPNYPVVRDDTNTGALRMDDAEKGFFFVGPELGKRGSANEVGIDQNAADLPDLDAGEGHREEEAVNGNGWYRTETCGSWTGVY